MKSTLIILIFFVFLSFLSIAQTNNLSNLNIEGKSLFHPNLLYIKLKQDAINEKMRDSKFSSSKFGIESLDNHLAKFPNVLLSKTFTLKNDLEKPKISSQAIILKESLERIITISFDSPYDLEKVISSLRSDKNIEYIEKVPIDYILEEPNDPQFKDLHHLAQMNAQQVWDIHKGENGTEVVVGICDTGIDWRHEDLVSNIWQNLAEDADGDGKVIELKDDKWIFDPDDENGIDDDQNGYVDDFIGWDFLSDKETESQKNDPSDEGTDHGTHVSGISAGATNNGIGIASISWNVKILTTSHSAPGYGYIARGFNGIVYLAENGADVINCSWGGGSYSESNAESIRYAIELGAIVVCAAGNNNSSGEFYPANYPGVVSIASLGADGVRAGYSNYGIGIDLAVPGGDYNNGGGIQSTVPGNNYRQMQGTSMASPLATGAIALFKSYKPNWTNDEIIKQILYTSDDIDEINPKFTNKLGFGRINLVNAFNSINPLSTEKLRLELVRPLIDDSQVGDGDGAWEPGEKIKLGFVIRSYQPYLAPGSLDFTISSSDKDVLIIKDKISHPVVNDGFTMIPLEFEIEANSEAATKFAKLNLEISSDNYSIVYGSSSDFEIPISAGGILVWEPITENVGSSGKFLSDYINDFGFQKVHYTNVFPASLAGFDIVLLSFGSFGTNSVGARSYIEGFDDWKADRVIEYLKQGGSLYIEGSEMIAYNQQGNKELYSLIGLDSAWDSDREELQIDTLVGNVNSLTKGLLFRSSRFRNWTSIDLLFPSIDAVESFTESNFGPVAVQYQGEFGQKVFSFSYPIKELIDHSGINNRYELVRRIIEWFGVESNYLVPNLTASPMTGHIPLGVKFIENFWKSVDNYSVEIDFENDGIIDSRYEQLNGGNYTFENSGEITTRIIAKYIADNSNNRNFINKTQDINFKIFNGESSVKLNGGQNLVKVGNDGSFEYDLPITIVGWFSPTTNGNSGRGHIFSIGSPNGIARGLMNLRLENNKRIVFEFMHNDSTYTVYRSQKDIFEYNYWNHFAIAVDENIGVKMWINGVRSDLDTIEFQKNKPLYDLGYSELFIGNRNDKARGFDGRLDQIALWRTNKDSISIFSNVFQKIQTNSSGLIGFWDFQEGNGIVAEDLSPYDNHAEVNANWDWGRYPGFISDIEKSQRICLGASTEFKADIIRFFGLDPVIKWYKDGAALSDVEGKTNGTNMQIMDLMDAQPEDEGEYTVTVSIGDTEIIHISNPLNLQVVTAPTEVKINAKDTIRTTQYAVLNIVSEIVGIDNSPVNYQWYRNFEPLPGQVADELSIFTNDKEDIGYYFCRVFYACGFVDSEIFYLDFTVDIKDYNSRNESFELYPNPISEGIINIGYNINSSAFVNIQLIDLHGFEIKDFGEYLLNSSLNSMQLNISDLGLSQGTYFIIVINGEDRRALQLKYTK